ncbi:unnamed protein product [Blepharisma stoltei]|uniref:Uncharacterized protein n=1 Tax=Blepharisma stoltei TaxID=1481888 RepID=A0AAU9JRY0_9CILI|nr:unnamed protein product [Blepharisma stoltei]
MKGLLIIALLIQGLLSENEAEEEVVIDEGGSYSISKNEVGADYDLLIATITDSDFDDQPTRIKNLNEDMESVLLDYDGQNYLVSVGPDFLGEYKARIDSEKSASFLQLNIDSSSN